MPDHGPMKLIDLKMGDHILCFVRNWEDAERMVHFAGETASKRCEEVLYLSSDRIEDLEINNPDDLIEYLHWQAEQPRSENKNRLSIFIELGGIIRKTQAQNDFYNQMRKIGDGFSDACCLTIWLVDLSEHDPQTIIHLFHSQGWLGIGDTIYPNPYHIPTLRIPSERQDPDNLYHYLEETLIQAFTQLRSGPAEMASLMRTDFQHRGRLSDLSLIRSLYDATTLGILIVDLDGRIHDYNPAFAGMIGYDPDELIGRRFFDLCPTTDIGLETDLKNILQANGEVNVEVERHLTAKGGQPICGRLNISLLVEPTGNPHGVLILIEDITPRRQLEDELIEVQRRLMQNREMERLRLAQDLHDSTLQDLYGLGFSLKELIDEVKDPELLKKLQAIQDHLLQQIQDLRLFCNELRPPTLVPFGLEKAIRSHSQNFQMTHPNLQVHLDLMPDGQQLPEPVRLALFRIYQEMISNVVRHSDANTITIQLQMQPDQVLLEISDNGQGFEIPERWVNLARQGHFGLVGALERAETVGGKMTVWSQPGMGTKVKIIVPASLAFEKA